VTSPTSGAGRPAESLLAQHLVSHGEVLVLAAKDQSRAVEIPGYVAGTYIIDPSHSDVAFTVTRAGWRSQ
jgi:hypothetical protein